MYVLYIPIYNTNDELYERVRQMLELAWEDTDYFIPSRFIL